MEEVQDLKPHVNKLPSYSDYGISATQQQQQQQQQQNSHHVHHGGLPTGSQPAPNFTHNSHRRHHHHHHHHHRHPPQQIASRTPPYSHAPLTVSPQLSHVPATGSPRTLAPVKHQHSHQQIAQAFPMHHQQVQAPAWASTVGPPEDPTTAVQTQRYERRVAHSLRQRVADRLTQIDNEVYQNHERMYQQKYMDIKQAIYLILAGTHPKYVEEVSRLAKKRDDSLVQVESFSRYMLDLYETEMNQILEQANASFEQEKQALYEKMFNNIEERRMRLNEEKDSMELNGSDYFGETGLRPSTKRNLRKRGVDSVAGDSSRSGAAHRRKMTQTFAMVGLSEEEIMKDLSVLRKSTGVTGPLGPGSSTGGKKGSKARKR